LLVNNKYKIERFRDSEYYINSKVKINAKYFAKLSRGYNKIRLLLINKMNRNFSNTNLQNPLVLNSFNSTYYLNTTQR